MIKLLSVVMVAAVVLGTVACSGSNEQGSKETNRKDDEKTVYREKTVVVERTTASDGPDKRDLPDDAKTKQTKAAREDKRDPDYEKVTDDTGAVSVEVPDEWDDRLTDEVATFADAPVGPSVTVSTNLDAWHNVGGVPGVYFLASRSLARDYTEDQLLDPPNNDFSSSCALGERTDLEREGYSGRVQAWGDCYDDTDTAFYTVAAAPEDRECVAVLQIGTYGEKDREAARRILDTFEVECEKADPPAGVSEESITETTIPSEPAPEEAVSCADFVTINGEPSQWQAQQFYDFQATAEQRAALDPDGNGFACDRGLGVPGPADGVCEGPGEGDPDCAAAMLKGLCMQYESREDALEQLGLDCPNLPSRTETPPEDPASPTPVPPETTTGPAGYPPPPLDPYGDWTCEEVGGGPYSVPPGSPHDADGDGTACDAQ